MLKQGSLRQKPSCAADSGPAAMHGWEDLGPEMFQELCGLGAALAGRAQPAGSSRSNSRLGLMLFAFVPRTLPENRYARTQIYMGKEVVDL